jgi:hypothetical protein
VASAGAPRGHDVVLARTAERLIAVRLEIGWVEHGHPKVCAAPTPTCETRTMTAE